MSAVFTIGTIVFEPGNFIHSDNFGNYFLMVIGKKVQHEVVQLLFTVVEFFVG